MVIGFIHLLTNVYHEVSWEKKNPLLKFKTWQKLQSSSTILAWTQPCICLHFSPPGRLGKTVGDWKPWSDQNCLDYTKGNFFVPLPKPAPNLSFFPFETRPGEVEVWLLLSMLCPNMFHAFQLLTSSIWEMGKRDGVNINRAGVMSLKRHGPWFKHKFALFSFFFIQNKPLTQKGPNHWRFS